MNVTPQSSPETTPPETPAEDPKAADELTMDAAARAIMSVLPWKYREGIRQATKQHGKNRKSRRITGALIRRGLSEVSRNAARDQRRLVAREEHAVEQAERVGSLGRPLRGMSSERFEYLTGLLEASR